MTREQQIRAAIHLLRRWMDHEHLRSAIELAIRYVESVVETRHNLERSWNPNKKQLKKLITALKRAQKENKQLQWEIELLSSIEPPVAVDPVLVLEKWIKAAESRLAQPIGPPHRTAHKQRVAVETAYTFLHGYRLPIKTTRKGLWHQLSAILFRDPKADLFRHMSAFSKRLKLIASRPEPGRK
jgi:hypothetical protein